MKGLPLNLDMARAWHEGRKTVHRVLMKPQPDIVVSDLLQPGVWYAADKGGFAGYPGRQLKPRYRPREVVYIQEPWHLCGADTPSGEPHTEAIYRADSETCGYCGAVVAWKSPITMPDHFSRSKARIVSVRGEQVQAITEEDVEREGILGDSYLHSHGISKRDPHSARIYFMELWDSLYPGTWDSNPWVWVYGLEKVEAESNGDINAGRLTQKEIRHLLRNPYGLLQPEGGRKQMTHSDLIKRAEKWLRNTFHCRVVLTELTAYTRSGETPDVIGWVNNRSILVECKCSQSDFYADKRKRSRIYGMPALGHWRFYLAPPGIIKQVPDGWGLYEVRGKRIVHICGAKYTNAGRAPFDSDRDSEIAMLLSALARKE